MARGVQGFEGGPRTLVEDDEVTPGSADPLQGALETLKLQWTK